MSTLDTIAPILQATYGTGAMVSDLAIHLATKIDTHQPDESDRDREYMVMLICWDWMTGGSTATAVAKKIEAALSEVSA